MKRFSTEFKVGLFVLGSIALIVYIGVKFGSFNFGNRYLVHVTLPHAQGVVALGNVQIAGVSVGRVEDLDYVDGGARMTLAIDSDVRLHRDATATIRPKSLLGEKVVELTPGSGTEPLIEDGGEIVNVIPSTDVSQLLNDAGQMFAKFSPALNELSESIGRINSMLAEDPHGPGRGDLATSIADTAALIRRMRTFFEQHEAELGRTLKSVDEITRKAGPAVDDLAKATAALRSLTEERKSDLEAIVKNSRDITTKLNQVLDKVNDPETQARIKSLLEQLDKALEKVRKSWLL
ncbi:MAG: MCE family protein [Nitrospirae bacterium]|nr:MCE family protein [Nitrospirota bacterium]